MMGEMNSGRAMPDGPGCQPSASAADASSQSGIPIAFIPGRYPYTYSADFIRGATMDPYADHLEPCHLSRAQAARLLSAMAEVVGFDRDLAARKLADAYCSAQGIEAEGESPVGSADAFKGTFHD